MNQTEVKANEVAEIKAREIDLFISGANIVDVTNQAEYNNCVALAKEVQRQIDDLEDERKSLSQPLWNVFTAINKKIKKVSEPLETFKKGLARMAGDYLTEKKRIADEEQRQREELARQEREKKEREAREERRKEELAKQKERDKLKEAQEEKDLAKKMQLEREAEKERVKCGAARAAAETKEDESDKVVAPVVQETVEKQGVYKVPKWTAEMVSIKTFIAWVVEKEAWEYLPPNMSLLNKEAQQTKGLRSWPGIRVNHTEDTRMRGK